MVGRPSKREKLTEAICERIAKGTRPEAAALLEGIGSRTYFRWLEDEDFRQSVARARARHEDTLLDAVNAEMAPDGETGKVDAKSARWLLERRYREDYGAELRIQARSEAARELVSWLREELDPETWARVAQVLASYGSEGARGDDGEASAVH